MIAVVQLIVGGGLSSSTNWDFTIHLGYLEVSKHGGIQNGWFIRGIPIKMDDLRGTPILWKPPYGKHIEGWTRVALRTCGSVACRWMLRDGLPGKCNPIPQGLQICTTIQQGCLELFTSRGMGLLEGPKRLDVGIVGIIFSTCRPASF